MMLNQQCNSMHIILISIKIINSIKQDPYLHKKESILRSLINHGKSLNSVIQMVLKLKKMKLILNKNFNKIKIM